MVKAKANLIHNEKKHVDFALECGWYLAMIQGMLYIQNLVLAHRIPIHSARLDFGEDTRYLYENVYPFIDLDTCLNCSDETCRFVSNCDP